MSYAEAITWDLPVDDKLWARLHKHFTEPQMVEIGYFVALTMGQQRWLRTLNIEHHQILAGTDASMAPGFETAEALAKSKTSPDYWVHRSREPSARQVPAAARPSRPPRAPGKAVVSRRLVAIYLLPIILRNGGNVVSGSGLIRVRGLGKRYGELTSLRMSISSRRRARSSLWSGPRVAAKPLCCAVSTGFSRDEGEITVDGKRVTGRRPASRWCSSISVCSRGRRSTTTSPTGCAWRGERERDRDAACRASSALVGLAGFEHAYPYQISGGMQQRCGLARALAIEPNVLLMDEPFAAVDAQTREILQFELLRIWEKQPTTMLFVTHSIEEAVLMGDRVLVLKGRPSHIDQDIAIDLPRPRSRDTLQPAALFRIARASLGQADERGAPRRIRARALTDNNTTTPNQTGRFIDVSQDNRSPPRC